jgi:UDP-2,3-diacylglucosamine pyrophosphatase LpxH
MGNNDFSKAQFTAVVSDLHLCEAEPTHPKFPLWKKYKTKQFFFDAQFAEFLRHIERRSKGETIELVLNGDIFDFDSINSIPKQPVFRVHWLEKKRGLYPRAERSKYKIEVIIRDHPLWFSAISEFIKRGHRVVFVFGNHDLELHYHDVQETIVNTLNLNEVEKSRVRFCEWFFISNKDTLIEHGNQYDPYCMCEDPVHPFIQGYNYKSIRLPFGNLACRYILNGMGFFNPHVDSNYIMSLSEYVAFFFKYIWRAQPLLIWDWFFGAMVTLIEGLSDRWSFSIRDPLTIEDKINKIAEKANADPRMVRELRELFVEPATANPFMIARELWLDRAFLIFLGFFLIFQLMLLVKNFYNLSFFWAFIPLFLLLPFFLFYSKSVVSMVSSYKEPDERILSMAGVITKTNRIVFGHTHRARHEMIGAVEHLNSGTWSPAFTDVECTQMIDSKTYVWIEPKDHKQRVASLNSFDGKRSFEALARSRNSSGSERKSR